MLNIASNVDASPEHLCLFFAAFMANGGPISGSKRGAFSSIGQTETSESRADAKHVRGV